MSLAPAALRPYGPDRSNLALHRHDAGRPDAPTVMAVDDRGTTWGHTNPAELYRFLLARNELLGTIAAAAPARCRDRASA